MRKNKGKQVGKACFHIHENKKHVGFTICWFK